jgi:RNA 2',3'-cyclic 3'-phosphodiesterase
MPRLFTGVEIPADVAMGLDLMRGGIPGARWIDRESYHITLRFIGDIEIGLAREIAAALDLINAEPFALRLKGVDVFAGRQAHGIFAAVEESPELRRLHQMHERLCQTLGLPAEPRKFTPHVTLARLKDAPPRDLQHYLAAHSLYASRAFEVGRFVLFSSRPSRGGGPYAVEAAYALGLGINNLSGTGAAIAP